MPLLRKTSDWFRYERLHHYPALSVFQREEALKRLLAYEREERKASREWIIGAFVATGISTVAWMLLVRISPLAWALMFMMPLPGWILQYALFRRIRRRVEAKVAAELRDGRLSKCVECDYDLRASEERCPECGAPVRVALPANKD